MKMNDLGLAAGLHYELVSQLNFSGKETWRHYVPLKFCRKSWC